ncbi:MAG: hypothetical protein D6816_13110 [Bacteroidetes bacterium]|nr:MAG: hypothetical protein D6816_13110 [Bacteroidota bacterium]
MTKRLTYSFHTHGESLIQFPGHPLIHYQFWIPGGLTTAFDAHALFDGLIHSYVYQHQRLGHSFNNSHGPFAVSKIRPEHYEPIAAEKVEHALHTRLIPASPEDLTRYRDPWPSLETLRRRLEALLTCIDAGRLRWYKLAIELEDRPYWSDEYRKAPILDHFEEWMGVDVPEAMVHMLQVIRD